MTKKTKAVIILFGFSMPSFSSVFGGGGSSSSSATSAAGSSGGGGAAFGALTDWYGAKEQNRANTRLAKNQMEFQESMSNTAYQRASNDLNKAGINRILAGKFGAASTPAGAMASMENLGAAALRGASSAKGMEKTNADIANTDASTFLKTVQTILASASIPSKKAQEKLYEQALKVLDSYFNMDTETKEEIGSAFTPAIVKFFQLFSNNQITPAQKKAFDAITGRTKPKKKSVGYRTR